MEKKTEVTITCDKCGSGIHVYPSAESNYAVCGVCHLQVPFKSDCCLEGGVLKNCPVCQEKNFYSQKDFNRKIGVILFVLAAILSIWTYGISFIVLYLFDLILYKKLGDIAVCYKCQTIFRNLTNVKEIPGFDHERNDRTIYSSP